MFFLNNIHVYIKKEGFKPTSRRQDVAEISGHTSLDFAISFIGQFILIMISLWSGPPGFNFWTSVSLAFQSLYAVEYSSCFISVMILDLYARCY